MTLFTSIFNQNESECFIYCKESYLANLTTSSTRLSNSSIASLRIVIIQTTVNQTYQSCIKGTRIFIYVVYSSANGLYIILFHHFRGFHFHFHMV